MRDIEYWENSYRELSDKIAVQVARVLITGQFIKNVEYHSQSSVLKKQLSHAKQCKLTMEKELRRLRRRRSHHHQQLIRLRQFELNIQFIHEK